MKTIIISISMLLLSATTSNAHIGVTFAKLVCRSYVGYSIQSKEIQRQMQCSTQRTNPSASHLKKPLRITVKCGDVARPTERKPFQPSVSAGQIQKIITHLSKSYPPSASSRALPNSISKESE